MLERWRDCSAERLAVYVESPDGQPGALGLWLLETHNDKGQILRSIVELAVNESGERIPCWERQTGQLLSSPAKKTGGMDGLVLLRSMETVLEREIKYRGAVAQDQLYSASLVGWLAVVWLQM